MNEPPNQNPRPSEAAKKNAGFARQLARWRKRVISVFIPKPTETAMVEDAAFWASILTGEKERDCPAREFRRVSFQLRRSGNFAAAEQVCARGVAAYPSDLPLAIEHALIAKSDGDLHRRMICWGRVLELGGNETPLAGFRDIAEWHTKQGDFNQAETILRRGLEAYPDAIMLMEKLASVYSAGGHSAKALATLRALIESQPEHDHSRSYLRMADVLTHEGLFDRAAKTLREGLDRFPESIPLQDALATLSFQMERSSQPTRRTQPNFDRAAHLFADLHIPHGTGTVCFHEGHNFLRQHVPLMLDFAKTVTPPDSPRRLPEVDVFTVWGPPSAQNPVIREIAAAEGKPLLCLESGFLSSPGIEGKDHPVHSVVISPDKVYFDNTEASYLENRLNSDEYRLTEEQHSRAEAVIGTIVSHRVSKFNHAPRIDMRSRFPANGTKRILVVDQRRGGSASSTFGGQDSFKRMWEAALATPDHEILIKLHPEVISGRLRSALQPLLPDQLPSNVSVIDYDVNPFDLFDVVDKVFVCTSQLGFEAIMAGKIVHCFAAPFYSGWGLTKDEILIPRRKRHRSLLEIFHLFYVSHSRYFVPDKGVAEIEELIEYLADQRLSEKPNEKPSPVLAPAETLAGSLKILIVVHCGRFGASGRYLQNLAWSLGRLGCKVMILAEGECPPMENGVPWHSIEFEGTRLSRTLREEIVNFDPDIVYESGVRSRAQRAALEALVLTNARFAMQSEDDDIQAYETHHGKAACSAMALLDKPLLDQAEIVRFLELNNWQHTVRVTLEPGFDYWIEPVIRAICYRLASLHTAIWYPFEKRLASQYGVPTLVVPPVSCNGDFERIPLSDEERASVLSRYGIDASRLVYFLGGALYPFSNEFSVFLAAFNGAYEKTGKSIALVLSSGAGRAKLPIDLMAKECLHPEIQFIHLGKIEDTGYTEMLKACDVVCSPGIPDSFNKFRLPSRLVKAMALGKSVLTCRCGFGESLENGVNAFLTDGENASEWAETIIASMDDENRERVARNSRVFAELNFSSDSVAAKLKKKFEEMMNEPRRMLGDDVARGTSRTVSDEPLQLRRLTKSVSVNRYSSSMHDAVQQVKLLAPRLGTVVHIGAGRCREFESYCQLGAKKILLVEALPELVTRLKDLESFHGNIRVKQAVVAGKEETYQAVVCGNIRPGSDEVEEMYLHRPTQLLRMRKSIQVLRTETVQTCTLLQVCDTTLLEKGDHMLVLEAQGLEDEILISAPDQLIQKFQWIAVRVGEKSFHEGGSTHRSVTQTLENLGFESKLSVPDFSGLPTASLFRNKAYSA